jgi:hypothetical protein
MGNGIPLEAVEPQRGGQPMEPIVSCGGTGIVTWRTCAESMKRSDTYNEKCFEVNAERIMMRNISDTTLS